MEHAVCNPQATDSGDYLNEFKVGMALAADATFVSRQNIIIDPVTKEKTTVTTQTTVGGSVSKDIDLAPVKH